MTETKGIGGDDSTGLAVAVVGYAAYAIYTGSILGKFRAYNRSENPWSFWATILLTLGIGLVFLSGAVSWRN